MELKLQVLADVVMDEEAIRKSLAQMTLEQLAALRSMIAAEATSRVEAMTI